jgi:hypothetical protein
MPTYRITVLEGLHPDRATSPIPAQLCCEQCQDVLHEFQSVEPPHRKLSGITAGGVAALWPILSAAVRDHESICKRRGF